jgi:DNA invertase Pin-like site-specific DNA recombinase
LLNTIRALKEAGCKKLFEEAASGGRWDRPELHRLLDQLRAGDTLVVWKLDRLSRSLKDLLTILERVDRTGAKFRSLTEAIETSGPAGRMLIQMLGAFAEFEREMIRERTRAGLREAPTNGQAQDHCRTKRRRSSRPSPPGAKPPPKSPACSKSTRRPSRGCSLRRASVCEPRPLA